MRSKEIEKVIKRLDVLCDFGLSTILQKEQIQDIDTLLSYISELEGKNEFKIKCAIEKEKVQDSWKKVASFFEDCKKYNIYTTISEKNAMDTINCYINDSTPNELIRDKIKELEYKTLYINGIVDKKETEMASIGALMGKIQVLKELLGE